MATGTNHLAHFLLANLLVDELAAEPAKSGADKRVIIVGSITGNTNTMAGNVPPKVLMLLPPLHICWSCCSVAQ